MRNNVAHGMLDDQAFQSFKALYIWWFALKFCYLFCGKLQEENRSKINKKLKQLMDGMGESRHIGIRNVQDRIQMLYGKEYGLSIRSEHHEYTEVRLTLPLKCGS